MAAGERVLIARAGGRIVGACRLCAEVDGLTLRGVYVAPDCQRQGLGSALVAGALRRAAGQPLYCIPFAHLHGFYARAGFGEILPAEAPAYLAERLRIYREKLGLDVILMSAP